MYCTFTQQNGSVLWIGGNFYFEKRFNATETIHNHRVAPLCTQLHEMLKIIWIYWYDKCSPCQANILNFIFSSWWICFVNLNFLKGKVYLNFYDQILTFYTFSSIFIIVAANLFELHYYCYRIIFKSLNAKNKIQNIFPALST